MTKTKVWFTGAHGTGKTTQMEYFHNIHPEYDMMHMERRDLYKNGIIKINQEAAPWDEVVIAGTAMLSFLSQSSPFISDRSWVCKSAYSQCLLHPDDLKDAYHVVNAYAFPGFTDEDIYFYFPPTLPLENDGVRSMNEEYRAEVDLWIQFYLNFFQIPYHTITEETVQNRHFQIEREVFRK